MENQLSFGFTDRKVLGKRIQALLSQTVFNLVIMTVVISILIWRLSYLNGLIPEPGWYLTMLTVGSAMLRPKPLYFLGGSGKKMAWY